MSLYEVLIIIHVLAAMVWIGGGVAIHVILTRTPAEHLGAVMPQAAWLGGRVLSAASVVLILAGIGLVVDGEWKLFEFWLLFSIAIWLISGFIGGAMIGKTAERLIEMGASGAPDHAETERLTQRILLLSRIDLVLLVLAVIDMVTKPGL